MLLAAVVALQGAVIGPAAGRELRAGLDTLYGGDFARAAAHFAALAARDTTDPAPLVFEAGAYIWWAAARDSASFELGRIDSLLGTAMNRARAARGAEFWLATAFGYRARQREENGHSFGAAKDAKAMRDIYRRILATDSTCIDCYLGLGVYDYGLARAGALARFFARIIGLGSGNAERGIGYMRRVARDGDVARVEGAWVLAAALMREAARDAGGRGVLQDEARGYVEKLAARYPGNPVFQRFLRDVSSLAKEAVRPPAARPAVAARARTAIGRRERGQLPQHVVHVALHRVGRDVEPLRDFLVAQPGGDQVLDLLLPLGQANRAASTRGAAPRLRAGHAGVRPIGRRLARHVRRRQIGPARHRANGFDDVVGRGVLHDEAVRAAFDELVYVLLGGNEIHHDGLDGRRHRFEIGEKFVAVAVGERGIEQNDLRFGIANLLQAGVGALDRGDDVDLGIRAEQAREPVTHQTIVFDHQHANARGGRDCGRCHPALRAAAILYAVALSHSILDSAPTLRRHPAFDATNCPRHTPPPLLDEMCVSLSGGGSHRRMEGG
jgi:hypothetical protein